MSRDSPWERPWPIDGLEHLGRCPACGGDARALLHDGLADLAFAVAPGRWTMWRCAACGSGYLDPRPAQSHIALAYAGYYTHQVGSPPPEPQPLGPIRGLRRRLVNGYLNARFGEHRTPAWRLGALVHRVLPRRRMLLEHGRRHLPVRCSSRAALLDVGCGGGAFLDIAAELGWSAHGIDPDPLAVARAQARGHDARVGGLELFADEAARFDAITLNHVVEHLPAPRRDLAACLRLLRPGGMLFVETPNVDALGHRRWGRAWRGLEAPRHLQLFSHAGLRALLAELGFTAIADAAQPDPRGWLDAASAAMAARDLHAAGATMPGRAERRRAAAEARRDPAAREFLCLTARRPSA